MENKTEYMELKLNRIEVSLIKTSWEKIKNKKVDIGQYHYTYLFEKHPELRSLFKSDINIQVNRLLESLQLTIDNLENQQGLQTYYLKLGLKHKGYKVKAKYYPFVIESLTEAIFHELGTDLTDNLQQAWYKLIRQITGIMIEGSKKKYISG